MEDAILTGAAGPTESKVSEAAQPAIGVQPEATPPSGAMGPNGFQPFRKTPAAPLPGVASRDSGSLENRKPPASSEKKLCGLRRSALLEMALFLTVALIVDHLFFGGKRFIEVSLHPFWLIVILISSQYGTGEGLVSAALSTAGLLLGNVPEQTLSQDTYQFLFDIFRLPLSWFVMALLLGEIRMRHMRERDKLRLDLADTAAREEVLSRSFGNLSLIKDKLEERVAGQLTTAITMFQAARDLEKLDPAEVLRSMANIVRAVMKPEKFSIYLLKDDRLEIAIHEGWSQKDNFSRTLNSGSPLFRAAIGGQRFLCCVSRDDEAILAHEGILAGPLINTATGEICGLLKIEKWSFLNLNFSNVQTFKILCQWIASAYGNARRYEMARSDSVLNAGTNLLSYGYFKQHTAHLTELARRLGFDLSMLIVRLENESELSPEKRRLVPKIMGDAVKAVLRKTDLIFEHQRSGHEYAIVLPNTPIEDAQTVAGKLQAYLGVLAGVEVGEARFSYSVHAIHREEGAARVYCGEVFPKQFEFFSRLAERVGFDLFMVEIRPAEGVEIAPDVRNSIHAIMCPLLENTLTPGETIVSGKSATCVYQILLFGGSTEIAKVKSDALSAAVAGQLEEKRIPVQMRFAVQAIHLHNAREYQYAKW
jgi:hypothetical protein